MLGKNYANNIAYKYKKSLEEKPAKYVEKKYSQVVKDVKALATALLDMGFKGKRVALIGENRYEWVISYLAVTCGGMVIAPLDKALPDKEIASLIKRSEVDVVIYEKKHQELFEKLKADEEINLSTLICIDKEKINTSEQKNEENTKVQNKSKTGDLTEKNKGADIQSNETIGFEDLLEKGRKLIKEKNKLYDYVTLNNDEMSIMLFTSGTTSSAKIVMLSQNNVLSNLYAYQTHFKINQDDTLLSFLPIHHTFECSITILYGFYSGTTRTRNNVQKNYKSNCRPRKNKAYKYNDKNIKCIIKSTYRY